MSVNVLVVDADVYWCEFARTALDAVGYRVQAVTNYSRLLEELKDSPEVILLGFTTFHQSEEEILRSALKLAPSAVFLALMGSSCVPQTIERKLLKLGVSIVMQWPTHGQILATILHEELKAKRADLASMSSYARFRLGGSE